MTNTQDISLSENVSAQTHGIVLCWSAFVSGEAKDYDWVYTFIPKWHTSINNGTGVISVGTTVGNAYTMMKYVYVYDNHIVGHAQNSINDSSASSGNVDNQT